MNAVLQSRCFIHTSRDAAGLCVDCRRFHCRECLVEHGGRLLCSSCVARSVDAPAVKPQFGLAILRAVLLVATFFFVWMQFYFAGGTVRFLGGDLPDWDKTEIGQ